MGYIMEYYKALDLAKNKIDLQKRYIIDNINQFMLFDHRAISYLLDEVIAGEYEYCADDISEYRENAVIDILQYLDDVRMKEAEKKGSFEYFYKHSGADDEFTDNDAFITFVCYLRDFRNSDDHTANTWHIEQNDLQRDDLKKSRRELLYDAYNTIIVNNMDVL